MTTAIVHDPVFSLHDTGMHPECIARLRSIEAALERRGTWLDILPIAPRPASRAQLERVHSAAMIDRIEAACRAGEDALDGDTVICRASFDAAAAAAGGALAAVDALMSGQAANAFVMARPPGHHATPSYPMGFCLLNTIAVAARYAQAEHGLERVLIVDWDVHHGNGTQDAFYEDPSIFFLSLHQMPLYPGTGKAGEQGRGAGLGFTRNLPMKPFTPAPHYRTVFHAQLDEVARSFQPELVLVSAGFDSHAQDPLGSLLLEDDDFAAMTTGVLDVAHRYAGGRLLAVLEGGYNLQVLGDTVASHIEVLKQG